MVDFLFSLPLWALAVILNVWLMGFTLTSLWAVRRWVLPKLRINTNAGLFYGAAVMQSGMVLYGLVAALTAVSVWQRYSDVSDIVSREATAINNLWRDLGGYPQREREAMREILRGYTNQIIEDAWPAQKQGRVPREGIEWMNRLQAQLFAFEPASESHKILHSETLGAYNRLLTTAYVAKAMYRGKGQLDIAALRLIGRSSVDQYLIADGQFTIARPNTGEAVV